MTITDRMAKSLYDLASKWHGRRKPKAFYLAREDYLSFLATAPKDRVTFPFGNNPTVMREDFGYDGVPVRESTTDTARSRLYSDTGSGTEI